MFTLPRRALVVPASLPGTISGIAEALIASPLVASADCSTGLSKKRLLAPWAWAVGDRVCGTEGRFFPVGCVMGGDGDGWRASVLCAPAMNFFRPSTLLLRLCDSRVADVGRLRERERRLLAGGGASGRLLVDFEC